MAVRLSVILIHSPPPGRAGAQRLAEEVVGELIGLGGIDLTLVGPIDRLSQGSADRLSLESLSGDVAVLDWQLPSEMMTALAGIEFLLRAPHRHDDEIPQPAPKLRRIYAFDLNRFTDAGKVIEALLELNRSRQVRTFTLDLPRAASEPASPASVPDGAPVKPGPPTSQPEPTLPEPTQPDSGPSQPRRQAAPSLNLDDLLDQLDQLDP